MRLILLLFLGVAGPAWADGTVAFFGLHMLDSSQQSATGASPLPPELLPEDRARLQSTETAIAERFAEEGFTLLDLAPVADDLARVTNPANCYGCDTRMARKLGASFILVGEVRKVSNALIAMNLQLRDGTSGRLVKAGSVDIRGNTDEMWARGIRYILKNRIFREDPK